jgi:hypothetical protein
MCGDLAVRPTETAMKLSAELEQVFREAAGEQGTSKADRQDNAKSLPFVLFDQIDVVPKGWLADKFLGLAETSCWYGEPGSGKSVLAEDFGLHVAAGMTWHGREVKQGAVLYIALERAQLVKRRALAFKIKHNASGLPFAITSGIFDFRAQKTATTILGTVAELEKITGQKLVLIIIDTISRALCGGDENSPKDMGALVNTIGRIQEGTGTHVSLIHHVPHEADRMRGHGSLLGAIDTTVHVVKSAGLRSGTVVKANDGDEGEQVNFTLESVEICAVAAGTTTAPVVVPSELTPRDRAGTAAGKLTDNQRRFMDILRIAILDAPADLKGTSVVPIGMQAVTRDILKKYLVAKGWLDDATSSKARAKLSDMINVLAGKNFVGTTKDYVWII